MKKLEDDFLLNKVRNGTTRDVLSRKVRDLFYECQSVYVYFLDENGVIITSPMVSKPEQAFIQANIDDDTLRKIAQRGMDQTFEEVCQEDLQNEVEGSVAILNVYLEEQLIGCWAILGFFASTGQIPIPPYMEVTTRDSFTKTLRVMTQLSKDYLKIYMRSLKAESELELAVAAKTRTQSDLRKNTVMTSIVKRLDSEEDIVLVMKQIFREVQNYLTIDCLNLMSLNLDVQTVNLICEVAMEDCPSYLSTIQNVPMDQYPFMTGQPFIISSNTQLRPAFQQFIENYQLKAFVSLPIEVNNQIIMYMNGWMFQEHIWDIEAIRFLHDVKRIVQSILSKRIAQNSLTSSFESLEAILKNIGCGIFVKDFTTNEILFRNELYGREISAELENRNISFHETNFLNDTVLEEVYIPSSRRWFDMRYVQIAWVDGRHVVLCTAHEVTDKKIYQQKIENSANSDFLTGLYNRMRCEEDLRVAIRDSVLNKGEGAVLFIDLDDFKHINDGLGHQYGDVLLKSISSSLKKITGVSSNCYRMGGDEFIILVTNQNYGYFEQILEGVVDIFSKPWSLKGAEYYCTMSMGVVRFPSDGTTVEDIIRKADIALLEAKKCGKNRVEFYDANVAQTDVKRLDMEKYMRAASINPEEEFEVYYQPIFDISIPGHPCTGAEALIRWNSANLGFISPMEFIPLAEYLGLITPIGSYVLEESCRRCKLWNDLGHPNYKINVNLSIIQLLQNDMMETLQDILERTGINPQNLTIEVTEGLAVNDMNYMKKILQNVKELGIRVALDDFGTGYSSLKHIHELPIDIIKVDRCFVEDVGKDEFSEVFIKMVSELAKAIGVNVCVEGVEVEEQFAIMEKLKVNMVQGFYFDKPMKLKDFEEKYV